MNTTGVTTFFLLFLFWWRTQKVNTDHTQDAYHSSVIDPQMLFFPKAQYAYFLPSQFLKRFLNLAPHPGHRSLQPIIIIEVLAFHIYAVSFLLPSMSTAHSSPHRGLQVLQTADALKPRKKSFPIVSPHKAAKSVCYRGNERVVGWWVIKR